MKNKYKDLLTNIIIQINENLQESSERKLFAQENELDYIEGKVMAFKEVIEIIKVESLDAEIYDFFPN